jgi:hypothetical protein
MDHGAIEMPSAAQCLIYGATPEMLRKLPSAAELLSTALSGPDRGPNADRRPSDQIAASDALA